MIDKTVEEALKILVEKGYSITIPNNEVYLVDHGNGIPMTTRKTVQPKKGRFNKIDAQRVALIKLDELTWIDFEAQDFNKENVNE